MDWKNWKEWKVFKNNFWKKFMFWKNTRVKPNKIISNEIWMSRKCNDILAFHIIDEFYTHLDKIFDNMPDIEKVFNVEKLLGDDNMMNILYMVQSEYTVLDPEIPNKFRELLSVSCEDENEIENIVGQLNSDRLKVILDNPFDKEYFTELFSIFANKKLSPDNLTDDIKTKLNDVYDKTLKDKWPTQVTLVCSPSFYKSLDKEEADNVFKSAHTKIKKICTDNGIALREAQMHINERVYNL